MSMAINVVGGFMAVVSMGVGSDMVNGVPIQQLNMLSLLDQFGIIPAGYQAALLLVVPLGIIIPLIAAAVGHIIIRMALGRVKLEQDTDEQRWAKEAAGVMYQALMSEALRIGATTTTAAKWAQAVSDTIPTCERFVVDRRSRTTSSANAQNGAKVYIMFAVRLAPPDALTGKP
jgi:hypothetical protein